MGRMVRAAVEAGLLVKGGGHAMAAGLTVERANLGKLRTFFEEAAVKTVSELVESSVLKIDGAIGASGATLQLVDQLEQAGPYGSGHSQPIFAVPAHRLRDVRLVGTAHVKITLEAMDGSRLEGIAFRAAEALWGRCCSMRVAGPSMLQAPWVPISGRVRGVCSCAFWTRLSHPDGAADLFEFLGTADERAANGNHHRIHASREVFYAEC